MKAVLISIKPKYCELIASGKKTVEVRKTKPKLETPFKCYIYCTQGDSLNYLKTPFFSNCNKFWVDNKAFGANVARANGKVIGEFVCDHIGYVRNYGDAVDWYDCKASCLSANEIIEYAKDKDGNFVYTYGWHISDLVIYDKPRELSEFYYPPEKYCEKDLCGLCPKYEVPSYEYGEVDFDCEWKKPIERPPQSWMYVEEQR